MLKHRSIAVWLTSAVALLVTAAGWTATARWSDGAADQDLESGRPILTSLDDHPTASVAAKVDRLARSAPAAEHRSGLTITTSLVDQNGTIAMPLLAYASLDNDTEAPFDRLIENSNVPVLPLRHGAAIETPHVDEEDEGAIELRSIPRPKPKLEVNNEEPMPLPRLKPAPTVSNTVLPPLEKSRGSVLAMLPPAGQPASPGNPVVTKTPFGVPYVLQTESVDTACLRPELIDILRRVEQHYGKKAVITSGYRDRGRSGSLHRRCAAADILVPGVTSDALAAYARTIPGIGGVGQYCHQSLVHVDVGTPRDWKYGCGSYFAMRDGSAGWGKKQIGD